MILLDYSGIAIASITAQLVKDKNKELDEGIGRHIILNNLLNTRKRFHREFGEIVLCTDPYGNYWRKDFFPHYKANRKKNQQQTGIDWNKVYSILNTVRDEIKEYFPYKFLQVERCEADDIIATLTRHFSADENTVIVSKDKDFAQLLKYDNVKQYVYTKKDFVKAAQPDLILQEHIIRGDTGDGIPNILSPDDTFVSGGRQKKLSEDKVKSWLGKMPEIFCDENMLRNYYRNKLLIDFTEIPSHYVEDILNAYSDAPINSRSKLFNYFREKKLRNLMEHLGDF